MVDNESADSTRNRSHLANVRHAAMCGVIGRIMSEWRPREVMPIDESEFVRGILAQRELASRIAARDAMAQAQSDRDHWARHGYPFASCPNQPPTRDEVQAIIARTDTAIENGEKIARAWLRIRTHDLAALQAEGGTQLDEPGEVPPTVRQPRQDEREPIKLPPIEMVTQLACDNGILQEDESESGQSKE